MKKLPLLAAGAVGYVLGTRAGRERYEQIKSGAQKIAKDPRVRSKVDEAGHVIKEQAPHVKDKVVETASHATQAAKEKVGSHSGGADQSTPYPQS
jgi:hypothetical protein